jgi:hypothetical protein
MHFWSHAEEVNPELPLYDTCGCIPSDSFWLTRSKFESVWDFTRNTLITVLVKQLDVWFFPLYLSTGKIRNRKRRMATCRFRNHNKFGGWIGAWDVGGG